MKYLLVDSLNLFFRVRHIAHRGATLNEKLALSMHMLIAASNKVASREGTDHVIFAMEGDNNWRKKFYSEYKKQRAIERQKRTEEEIEEEQLYFEVFNDFIDFIKSNTNCSVIKANGAEADDVIARFIKMHPNDHHTILSSDTDYYQLINENVAMYNGVDKILITHLGVFDDNAKPVIDKKTEKPKHIGDPKWLLFEKCMRGDKTDNIFSAFPGVRTKSTKKKVGLLDAYADMDKKGYNWNNVMLQRWLDHEEKEHRVLDDYERNKTLIDLDAQPQEIKDAVDEAIVNEVLAGTLTFKQPRDVNFKFMKFCGQHDLPNLLNQSDNIVRWLSKSYQGDILNILEEQDGETNSEASS